MRRVVLVVAVLLGVLALVGVGLVVTGDEPTALVVGRDGPMHVPAAHGQQVMVGKGEMFTDGFETLKLEGSEPAKILSISTAGTDGGIEQVGALLAGPQRKYGAWTYIPGWPPNKPSMGTLIEAKGATIDPVSQTRNKMGYQLLLGYRVEDASRADARDEVVVRYEVDGTEYEMRSPARLVTCPKEWSDKQCTQESDKRFPDG